MDISRGGIEGDLDIVCQHVRQQTVDPVTGGLQAHLAGAAQAFGGGIDAHHPHGLQHFAAQQLVKQIGADIARPDQGTFDLFAHG